MEVNNINSDYKSGFLSSLDNSITGQTMFIENPLERVEEVYNIGQSTFTLIGSSSGAGKSAYIDYNYVLKVWDFLKVNPDYEVHNLYYSQERKKMLKQAKWLAWLLYRDRGWIITPKYLLGDGKHKHVSEDMYKTIRSYDEEMSQLLDVNHIHDGRISVEKLGADIFKKAMELGTLFIADSIGVQLNGEGSYIATFDTHGIVRKTRNSSETAIPLKHKDTEFTITPDSKVYFFHNPKTLFQISLDGIGLVEKPVGGSKKSAIDDVTDLLADARDVFHASPIMVSQFNRAIADIHRQKSHGSDLSPQEGDFKDSSAPYQAADLVLGLFDPVRFKAYDRAGTYGGYDVRGGMVSPEGKNRFRSLHVLKNTFGTDGVVFGLKFLGEMGHFQTLPYTETDEIYDLYREISEGR